MADPAALDDPIPNLDTLPIPDDPFFSDDLAFSDNYDDVLNFNIDDLDLSSDDIQLFLSSITPSSNSDHPQSNSFSPESFHLSDDSKLPDVVVDISGEKSSDDVRYSNISSSDSRNSCHENFGVLNYKEFSGPVSSQGSDDCVRSFDHSPDSGNRVVDQRIEVEESGKNHLFKRKKEDEDGDSVIKRTIKFRRSNEVTGQCNVVNDEEEKKNARLIRNRESAHLSRQKKKQYVEELEDKVRAMHSTIQDLNAKILYIVAENTTLRQQMNCGSVAPPVPGMYPHPGMAPMGYPWTPYPPYFMKSQGSQVPLVPIPRLKPKVQHDKTNKNGESKKKEGRSKTKKVASVSFLGLLFFILLFGGLVPMVNVKNGGLAGMWLGRSDYNENRFGHQQLHGSKVLVVNGSDHDSGTKFSGKNLDTGNMKNYDSKFNCHQDHGGAARANIKQSNSEDFALSGNVSDHLVASLYVPRNDKFVKIDGNLIIHSVLASEKAKISNEDGQTKNGKNSLAVPSSLAPAISSPGVGKNIESLPHLYRSTTGHRVLASRKDDMNSTLPDGELQQWFLEGLGGPVLRSGMCTEVFQFDVSPTPGAITPITSVRNISVEENRNSTRLNKGQNRRILRGLPIPLAGSSNNISEESARHNSKKENSNTNSSHSPMVVSVLVDPRDAGDFNDDGILGTKPLSRIFVVVLLDSVKYVTYSCMLPFKGSNLLGTA